MRLWNNFYWKQSFQHEAFSNEKVTQLLSYFRILLYYVNVFRYISEKRPFLNTRYTTKRLTVTYHRFPYWSLQEKFLPQNWMGMTKQKGEKLYMCVKCSGNNHEERYQIFKLNFTTHLKNYWCNSILHYVLYNCNVVYKKWRYFSIYSNFIVLRNDKHIHQKKIFYALLDRVL